jgi:hypothetical protein
MADKLDGLIEWLVDEVVYSGNDGEQALSHPSAFLQVRGSKLWSQKKVALIQSGDELQLR